MKNKLTHRQAHFHQGHHGGDRCGTCISYVRENQCKKVLGPLDENDWCAVGISKRGGHRFDSAGPKLEGGLQSMVNRREKK